MRQILISWILKEASFAGTELRQFCILHLFDCLADSIFPLMNIFHHLLTYTEHNKNLGQRDLA
jgi:hypothetical protein